MNFTTILLFIGLIVYSFAKPSHKKKQSSEEILEIEDPWNENGRQQPRGGVNPFGGNPFGGEGSINGFNPFGRGEGRGENGRGGGRRHKGHGNHTKPSTSTTPSTVIPVEGITSSLQTVSSAIPSIPIIVETTTVIPVEGTTLIAPLIM